MPSLTSALSLAVLASVALAAPTSNKHHESAVSKSSFTVPRVKNANYVRNGPRDLARAYAKFGWSKHWPGQSSSGGEDSTGWLQPASFDGGDGDDGEESASGSDSSYGFTTTIYPSSAAATTAAATTLATQAAASSVTSAEDAANGYSTKTSSAAAAAATTSGSVVGEVTATSEEQNCEFLCPVVIGGKTFNLDFDTGSSDLWVYGSQAAGSHVSFDTSSSNFTELADYSFTLSYGDGSSSSGIVGLDTVSVGGATVTKQAVEVATTVSSAFSTDVADGLLGLAFDSINQVVPKQQKTFFSNIQSQLEQPLFTVYLNETTASGATPVASGEYEFGQIDSSKYTGSINYTPVQTTYGFWQFSSTSYSIDGVTASNANASPTIADTGTSLILMDDAVVTAYYAKVNGASYVDSLASWTVPCSAALPEFGIEIGSTGYYATVPGDVMNYGSTGLGGYGSSASCYGGLQSNSGQQFQIIGDVMLREHFVVFDGGATRIGFANKA